MPRSIKPKTDWHAAALISDVTLTPGQVEALCEAAGLDPRSRADRVHRIRLCADVEEAIGVYRAHHGSSAPRPAHQRAALRQVEGSVDALIDALGALDDFSLEALQGGQGGFSVADALTQLRGWTGRVTQALRRLDGQESRGRVQDTSKRVLLRMLADAFQQISDAEGSDLVEFLLHGCKAAGARLSTAQAQTAAKQLLPKTTP